MEKEPPRGSGGGSYRNRVFDLSIRATSATARRSFVTEFTNALTLVVDNTTPCDPNERSPFYRGIQYFGQPVKLQ